MTSSSSHGAAVTPARPRVPTPAVWMLVSAPFLLAVGAFITVAMQPFVTVVSAEGDAVLMAWVGVILLCLGVVFLTAGSVLVGVRSMLRQQTDGAERSA